MTPSSFVVTAADVAALRHRYESGYGDRYPDHLRETGISGFEKSQYRFTRVAVLDDWTLQLATEPRYQGFFAENESEFDALKERMQVFMRRAVRSLDSIARAGASPQPVNGNAAFGDEVFQDLMAEWHERFAADCREHFILLATLLARAVLRAEPSEAAVVARLREIGFPNTSEPEKSGFPLNSLTVLGLAIFAYLVVVTIWFSARTGTSAAIGIGVAGKLTIALTGLDRHGSLAAAGLSCFPPGNPANSRLISPTSSTAYSAACLRWAFGCCSGLITECNFRWRRCGSGY